MALCDRYSLGKRTLSLLSMAHAQVGGGGFLSNCVGMFYVSAVKRELPSWFLRGVLGSEDFSLGTPSSCHPPVGEFSLQMYRKLQVTRMAMSVCAILPQTNQCSMEFLGSKEWKPLISPNLLQSDRGSSIQLSRVIMLCHPILKQQYCGNSFVWAVLWKNPTLAIREP